MGKFFARGNFATRLASGLFLLVFITTLSAGVPAFWLTRTQLERQAWTYLENSRQATILLLQAEQNRLLDQVRLLAERPTLLRLVQEQALDELPAYLQQFNQYSRLDILELCDAAGNRLAGSAAISCASTFPTGFVQLAEQAAVLVSLPLMVESTTQPSGRIIAGIWLNDPLLRQLAARMGNEYSLLGIDGRRLASSSPEFSSPTLVTEPVDDGAPYARRIIETAAQHYYVTASPLQDDAGQTSLSVEVALSVDDLLLTERQALTVLATSTGLVALLGVVLSIWYVRQLNAPLQQLTQVADRISQGDLVTSIPVPGGPVEVATLANALRQSQASMLKALAERAQARDWLDNLIQSIVEGVVTFDTRGRITFLSQGAEKLTGWRPDEIVGRPINMLFPAAVGVNEPFIDLLPPPGGKSQIETRTRAGKPIVLAVTGARLVPPDGDTPQVALVLRDVTEEEARRHLTSYFLANISHEFRTPLSTLNASIELLLDEAENLSAAEMRQLLQPTYLSLLGLQTLIDNLLESGSIEAGRFALRRRQVQLEKVIADALHVVQPLLERRRHEFSLLAPPQLPEIQADPTRLMQALVNLLTNAAKYSPIGQPIEMQVALTEDHLRIAVADRGPGIPEVERANLFRRFVRLNAQAGEQYGIGLGLYVVKKTIEAHGGSVGVAERPGGGSLFWFELPLQLKEAAET